MKSIQNITALKELKDYLQECCDGNSIPANTIGIGNPSVPGEDMPGSGDMFPKTKAKKQRRRKNDLHTPWEQKDQATEAFEGLLDVDYDVDDEVIKFVAAAEILKKLSDTKRSNVERELIHKIGKPDRGQKTTQAIANGELCWDGCAVLVARTFYTALYRFSAASPRPDMLRIDFDSSTRFEIPAIMTCKKGVNKLTIPSGSDCWVFKSCTEDQFEELVKYLKSHIKNI